MELFNRLGLEIERLWREKNYGEDSFPAIAAESLREARLPERVSAWDVMNWTMKELYLPEQQDLSGRFGDPPITVYNSPRFYIDVYFWLEGTTAIHQHAFCGAFQVLHGSSIHSWYDFKCRERINQFTEIGEMQLKVCELLKVGDVQEIWAGRQYIHGLFHLDQPSATIVVRTRKSPMSLPQYSYHKPFLALDPFFEEANSTKKMQCVTALIRAKHPDTDRFIAEWLETADFQTTYMILSTVRAYFQSNQLDRLFNLDAPQSRFNALLDIARKRHGALAEVFPKVFAYQEMLDEILRRRAYVTDPEHRFFLALLVNVEGKERIMSLVRQRFPDADPLDKILDWTFDLAQTRVLGMNATNALGIADFDDFDLLVLEYLLQDKSQDEMRAALAPEIPDAEALSHKLAERTARLRQAVMFQPLWTSENIGAETMSAG